jgi:anti-sigma B factor antagonist
MSISEISPFAAALEVAPGQVTVRLTGELDLATRPEFDEALDEAVATGAPQITVDMRELAFIDSTGISTLLRAVDAGRHNGHVVQFLRKDGPVARTLKIAGVSGMLPLAA